MAHNHQEILDFISSFRTDEAVVDLFTNKCCYWFAKILSERFDSSSTHIRYDLDECHFFTEIDNRFYDITGELDRDYAHCARWEVYKELFYPDAMPVIEDCILLKRYN